MLSPSSLTRLRQGLAAAAPLARLRLIFLVLAAGSAVLMVPGLLTAEHAIPERLAATIAVVALAGYWVFGYARGAFSLVIEPLEALAVFLALSVYSGDPFLPLFGLLFRSLYGTLTTSLVRYALWSAALLGAHASRGAVQLHDDVSRVVGLGLVSFVLPALRHALDRLESSERRLRSLVQNSTDVVTVIDERAVVRWQASSIRAVLGYEPGQVLGGSLLALVHADDRADLLVRLNEALGEPGTVSTVSLRLRHADGDDRFFEVVVSNRLHDRSVRGLVLNMRDATERHRLEQDLRALAEQREHDAMHDPLTGLPNRRRLFAWLEAAIGRAHSEQAQVPLLAVDLEGLTEVNDTLGHHAGDEVLRETAVRLRAACPEGGLVARFDGDQFAIVLPVGADLVDAERVAARVCTRIGESYDVQDMTLLVRACVGIGLYPDHAADAATLTQRADIAMYSARARGAGHASYDPDSDQHSPERLALIGELPRAIESGQLVLHYQPKFDVRTGAVIGSEALVRWAHPTLGLLGPASFVPLAEQAGLMRPFTLHVLDTALEQTARWDAGGLQLNVAVNVGAANLLDAALPLDVRQRLDRWGVSASRLVLEVTETMVAADPVRICTVLEQLGAQGITLSLDDFGTGSSSLSFLRRLPVQELKIDRSFVLNMAASEPDAAIVRTIIELGRNLGLLVVAEGIETEEVLRRLASFGCDQAQGFLLGRPMPAEQLGELARSGTDELARRRRAA